MMTDDDVGFDDLFFRKKKKKQDLDCSLQCQVKWRKLGIHRLKINLNMYDD